MTSVPVGQPPLAVASSDRLIPDGRSVRGPPLRVRRCLAAQVCTSSQARWLVPRAQADFEWRMPLTLLAPCQTQAGLCTHTL